MKYVKTLLAAGLLAASTATPALAQNISVFVAGGLGMASVDVSDVLTDDTFTYEFLAGFEVPVASNGLSLGIDGGWRDFGEADYGSLIAEVTGFTLGGRVAVPIYDENVRLIGRVGALFWDGEIRSVFGPDSGDDIDVYYAGGFDFKLTPNLRIGTELEFYSFGEFDVMAPMARISANF